MHHDFFAWVRLLLLIILILAFAVWVNTVEPYIEQPEKPEQEEQTYLDQATTPTITLLKAEEATEPTLQHPMEEITPTTEAATIATEPPTEPETEPPTEPETEPIYSAPPYDYTEKDLEYLALVIYQEAGGDMYSDKTRLMVGTVVMNRVADDRYPDTIFDVILQRSQYGRLFWTGPMWPSRRWEAVEAHAVERAYTIAERILNGERALPADVIFQSEYIQGTEIVAHQGGYYFCR